MRVHATDQLFGLEAFSRPIRVETDAIPEGTCDDQPIEAPWEGDVAAAMDVRTTERTDEAADVSTGTVEVSGSVEETTGSVEAPDSVEAPGATLVIRALLSRKIALGLVFFLLASTVGMSLFTLVMKTRRKAVSYELAHQTRLFKRMSKHRAVYELEYAYLRASSPIQEELSKQGWREITPHDLTYIPVKENGSISRGGQAW